MKQRVLHLMGTAKVEGTGVARIVCALAKGLDSERYDLHACFWGGPGPLVTELEAAGVTTFVIPGGSSRVDLVMFYRLHHIFRRCHYATIHQHAGGRSLRVLARASTRSRILLHLHGRIRETESHSAYHLNCEGADDVVTVSKAVATMVQGAHPRIVYPGVGVPEMSSAGSESGHILGTACRLVPVKGLSDLITAISIVRRKLPGIRLEIAGSGPLQSALNNHIAALGLTENAVLLGWRPEVRNLLNGWDIYVQPSLEEGFGIALLEAMAAGLPVVATNVGATPEIVLGGHTGLLVRPSDPEALAHGLAELLANPQLRKTMGQAGRQRVQDFFSTERMVRGIERIYAAQAGDRAARLLG